MLAPIVLPSVHYLNICRNNTFDEAEPYGIKNKVLRSRIVQAMNSGESSKQVCRVTLGIHCSVTATFA